MLRAGRILYRERSKRKLTLEDVEEDTKIKSEFLAAIEKGEYSKLPSAYAQGFVKNYAEYLDLSSPEIIALYRREFDEKKSYKVLPDALTKQEEFSINRVRIQQSIFLVAGVLVIFLTYLVFQYRSSFLPPSLSIVSPKQGSVVGKDVTVHGKADSDATVLVNNEAVSTESSGEFTKNLTLFPGKTTITIKAKSRFGKEAVVQREVVVK